MLLPSLTATRCCCTVNGAWSAPLASAVALAEKFPQGDEPLGNCELWHWNNAIVCPGTHPEPLAVTCWPSFKPEDGDTVTAAFDDDVPKEIPRAEPEHRGRAAHLLRLKRLPVVSPR